MSTHEGGPGSVANETLSRGLGPEALLPAPRDPRRYASSLSDPLAFTKTIQIHRHMLPGSRHWRNGRRTDARVSWFAFITLVTSDIHQSRISLIGAMQRAFKPQTH